MLTIKITDRKQPTPIVSYTPKTYPAVKTLYSEMHSRDQRVRDLFNKCPYVVGDKCRPVSEDGFAEYGACTIEHVCKSYADLGKDYEWKNDNPLIVTAINEKGLRLFCSTDYLKKV